MSTLWTPGGERPIRRDPESSPSAPAERDFDDQEREPSEEEIQAHMEQLRDELARTPAEVVIVNHAVGLFELARLYLTLPDPQLEQARLAIDALGYLVEGLGDRLGEHGEELVASLAQLRMFYVQLKGANSTRE